MHPGLPGAPSQCRVTGLCQIGVLPRLWFATITPNKLLRQPELAADTDLTTVLTVVTGLQAIGSVPG